MSTIASRLTTSNTHLSNIYSYISDEFVTYLANISSGTSSLVTELSSISSDTDSLVDALTSVNTRLSNIYTDMVSGIQDVVDAIEGLDISAGSVTVDFTSLQTIIEDGFADVIDAINATADDTSFSIWDLLIGAIAVSTILSAFNTLASTLEDTFPFGAIFMIIAALSVLATDPVAPDFSYTIFDTRIDLSLSQFDTMAYLLRSLLFVLYCIGLFRATKDWLFPTKDD